MPFVLPAQMQIFFYKSLTFNYDESILYNNNKIGKIIFCLSYLHVMQVN